MHSLFPALLQEVWEGSELFLSGAGLEVRRAIFTDPKDHRRAYDVTSLVRLLFTAFHPLHCYTPIQQKDTHAKQERSHT